MIILSAVSPMPASIPATPSILALDFDGVICDGMAEYIQTAWGAYCQLWGKSESAPSVIMERFPGLRPVVETGWEMPVLMEAICQGISDRDILQNWPSIAPKLAKDAELTPQQLSQAVDQYRDRWIENDLEKWLALHRFYPGVIQRLNAIIASATQLFIVTTKEERFARQLLLQEGIELPPGHVFGKGVKRPKYQTLRILLGGEPTEPLAATTQSLWFVEDRLKALQLVTEQSDLSTVPLFLADWGYNTAEHRQWTEANSRIQLLSLNSFQQDFEAWL